MTANPAILVRTLITYAVCLALALLVGYQLATPLTFESVFLVLLVLTVLLVPLLLRWHYAWLVLAWNMSAMVFILPGRPSIGMLMIAVSMLISLLQHILNRDFKFVHVPAIAWPLIFLTMVVVATARMRGGGLQMFGASSIGGRRYLTVLLAIVGYFALTAHRIPWEKARLYVGMYFLSALTVAVSNLAGLLGPGLSFIYLVFPIDAEGIMALNPENALPDAGGEVVSRWGGLAFAGSAILSVLLAFYGVRGMFDLRRPWRLVLFIATWLALLVGGYRSMLITAALIFLLVFWFEGLMRSPLLPIFVLTGVMCASLVLPFASSLPYMVQRTISFIPGLRVDAAVRMDVDASNDWRIEMWKHVLPDVPKYLLLGKGYAIDAAEFSMITGNMTAGAEVGEGAAMAGDYHNGPLSLVMPFGIAGVIGFLWFLWAGVKVLHYYYRNGDPALRHLNVFLLATFLGKAIFFMTIFGSFYGDLVGFTGVLGLGVAINGPVGSFARASRRTSEPTAPARLSTGRPAYAKAAR